MTKRLACVVRERLTALGNGWKQDCCWSPACRHSSRCDRCYFLYRPNHFLIVLAFISRWSIQSYTTIYFQTDSCCITQRIRILDHDEITNPNNPSQLNTAAFWLEQVLRRARIVCRRVTSFQVTQAGQGDRSDKPTSISKHVTMART